MPIFASVLLFTKGWQGESTFLEFYHAAVLVLRFRPFLFLELYMAGVRAKHRPQKRKIEPGATPEGKASVEKQSQFAYRGPENRRQEPKIVTKNILSSNPSLTDSVRLEWLLRFTLLQSWDIFFFGTASPHRPCPVHGERPGISSRQAQTHVTALLLVAPAPMSQEPAPLGRPPSLQCETEGCLGPTCPRLRTQSRPPPFTLAEEEATEEEEEEEEEEKKQSEPRKGGKQTDTHTGNLFLLCRMGKSRTRNLEKSS